MELGIYKSEGLANAVIDRWDVLSKSRDENDERLKDLYEYLFSPDTSFTEVDKNGWNNTTNIPKLTQIYDNLIAQYISTIHPDDSWVSFEGAKQEDMLKESNVEIYLRHKLKESGFIETERELFADWLWAGRACSSVYHVNEKSKSLVNPEEEIVIYRGPKSFRISPVDYVINPRANSFDESEFIRRRIIPRSSLAMHNESDGLIKYNEEAVSNAMKLTGYIHEDADSIKDSNLRVDGFNSLQEYFMSGMCEVLEFWGDIYDPATGEYLKNQTIGIVDRLFVLWNQPNPMWNGRKPYAYAIWRHRPDNLYGQSPLEPLVGMQYRVNHIENAKADVLDRTLHPTVDVFGDSVDDYDDSPGAVNIMGTDCKVQYNRPDASVLQANIEIANYLNLMEEMAGSPKQTAGFRTPGEKTKFEVSQLNEGAMKMFLEKTRHWENTLLKRHLQNFYTVLAMNFDVLDTYRVLDDISGAMELISVSKDDVIRDGNFKLMGSENYIRRNKMLLDLRDGATTLYANPRTETHVSSLNYAKMIEREMDWERYGIVQEYAGVTEAIDAQLAGQAHQQKRMKEMEEMGVELGGVQTEPGQQGQ